MLVLAPVTAAVYRALNVPTLTAWVGPRIYDRIPQAPTFPLVWIEAAGETDIRGLGTGYLGEVDLRVHVFSDYDGLLQAQAIAATVILLLKDQALTLDGFTPCGLVVYDRTIVLPDEVIAGVAVREVVCQFRVSAEAV